MRNAHLASYSIYLLKILYQDGRDLASDSVAKTNLPSTPSLDYYGLGIFEGMQGQSWWLAYLDAPAPAPSFLSLLLALPALRPHLVVLVSCMSTQGWPCWLACLDAPVPAPSFLSLLLAPSALRPHLVVLVSCMSTQGSPCWLAYLDAPAPAPSFLSLLLALPALRPHLVVLVSCMSTQGCP